MVASLPSGLTLPEACDYIQAQCGLTAGQIDRYRDAICELICSGQSVVEACHAIRLQVASNGAQA